MTVITMHEAKTNLSKLVALVENGSESRIIISRGDVPVAVIIPYGRRPESARRFGFAKDDGKSIDWAAFDAMDAEIAEMFGV